MKVFLFSIFACVCLCSFVIRGKKDVTLPKEFVFIPSGSVRIDSTKIDIAAFYVSKYEVSNQQYRNFLKEVAPSLSASELAAVLCDTTGWRKFKNTGAIEKVYFTNESFNDYPAVNIPYEGAIAYCKWMERRIQQANPGVNVQVRLPRKEEWILAAEGGLRQAKFPWSNYYLRDKKGRPMCNFRSVEDGSIFRNPRTGNGEVGERWIGEGVKLTSSIASFKPNHYGLYNMCGNVAEMIFDRGVAMGGSWNDFGGDVHIRAQAKYSGAEPTVGFRPAVIVSARTAAE